MFQKIIQIIFILPPTAYARKERRRNIIESDSEFELDSDDDMFKTPTNGKRKSKSKGKC